MNIMNVSYEIIPPTEEDLNYNNTLQEYNIEEIRELRMQAAIERFASFDEFDMEIPGFGELEDDVSDDNTILYDDEVYGFNKCGEIEGCYDYSEFNEADTILPDYDDYQLEDDTCPMDIDDDSDYWNEMRYERMVEMEHEIDRD
jgi:hypothetical protein